VPIEIRRFGVGHRRSEGPPGTEGVTGQPIHSDARGAVTELAFARGARIEPHTNPNTTWLVVIEGGGWVGVGDERTRVAAGEAVLWPPDVAHAAWTEHSEMRAIVVELAGSDDSALRGIVEGRASPSESSSVDAPAERAIGGLVADGRQTRHDPEAGEPA
jgi:quercetin dioxygenase-like cupin family protein